MILRIKQNLAIKWVDSRLPPICCGSQQIHADLWQIHQVDFACGPKRIYCRFCQSPLWTLKASSDLPQKTRLSNAMDLFVMKKPKKACQSANWVRISWLEKRWWCHFGSYIQCGHTSNNLVMIKNSNLSDENISNYQNLLKIKNHVLRTNATVGLFTMVLSDQSYLVALVDYCMMTPSTHILQNRLQWLCHIFCHLCVQQPVSHDDHTGQTTWTREL